jgi:hypothetical protein
VIVCFLISCCWSWSARSLIFVLHFYKLSWYFRRSMLWCRWLRQFATSQKVVCSIPGEVTRFFNWPNVSSCHGDPGVNLTSNINELQGSSLGVKGSQALTASQPSVSWQYRKFWSLNISKPSRYTQNYWGSGLCPSSGILKTWKHNDAETGCVSILIPDDGQGPEPRNSECYTPSSESLRFYL